MVNSGSNLIKDSLEDISSNEKTRRKERSSCSIGNGVK
jgi:hypothetical protein